jgi:hypothetical protein
MTNKTIAYLQKGTGAKKWKVTIVKPTGKRKTVQFGAKGYSDYTIHKDKERMNRYTSRHKTRENWNKSGIETAGFWSKHLLWNKPSLAGSISATSRKFGITIKRGAPPKAGSVKRISKSKSKNNGNRKSRRK